MGDRNRGIDASNRASQWHRFAASIQSGSCSMGDGVGCADGIIERFELRRVPVFAFQGSVGRNLCASRFLGPMASWQ